MITRSGWFMWRVCLLCGLVLLLAGCAGAPPTPTLEPSPTPRDDSAIRASLAEGVHADTYSLGTGPNTYCAVCKSPANWDPQAVVDAPPNCVSCKFESDTTMRVGAMIDAADILNIGLGDAGAARDLYFDAMTKYPGTVHESLLKRKLRTVVTQ